MVEESTRGRPRVTNVELDITTKESLKISLKLTLDDVEQRRAVDYIIVLEMTKNPIFGVARPSGGMTLGDSAPISSLFVTVFELSF